MCCKVCVCGQKIQYGVTIQMEPLWMVIFVSVLYLLYKKETYCQYVLATLGLACSTRRFSGSALGVKQEPEKGVLLSYVTLVHSLSSQDLFPYDWHYPIARTAKNISLKWNNSLLIRLGRNCGTDRPINHRWHHPQFTVARKTCVYCELVERDIVEL